MKKKKIRKTILAILIVIIAVVCLISFNAQKEEETKKLANLYNKLNANQEYTFTMEKNNENKTIIAKKNNKTVIDRYLENNHETTLIENDITYYILHNREEYHVYNQNNVEQNYLIDGMKLVIDTPFLRGTEKVNGKKYSYEEYDGSTIFMITNTLNIDDENIKTRFYFDNEENLVYIRTIVGVKQELLKIELKTEVENKIFEIPSNYAENSYN